MNFTKKDYTFHDLIDIMKLLRGANGCPWDRAQTHQSIKSCLLEEACEAMEALDKKQPDDFADELGDVLLQVVFHAEIAQSEGTFDIQDVINHICKKLISRHTHIFGKDNVNGDTMQALDLWEENKKAEKGLKTQSELMQDICSYLPALLRAEKVQKKAADVGFDWENLSGAMDKLREETEELESAIGDDDLVHIEEELGDLLFSCVNVSRFLKLDPEDALKHATDKFISRFEALEQTAKKNGTDLNTLSLNEMDSLWNEIKKSFYSK